MTSVDQHLDLYRYTETGYAVLADALSADEVRRLCAETATICRGERGMVDGIQPAGRGESDDAAMRRYIAINFPHKISTVLREAMRLPVVVDALTRVIGPNVKACSPCCS